MRRNFPRVLNTTFLGALLLVPLTTLPTALRADEHKYHDAAHNDDHVWNDHEDRAYRMWLKETHHKHRDFDKLREEDRQAYWAWRHEHSDAVLKIDIR
jgi:hypothetical protein